LHEVVDRREGDADVWSFCCALPIRVEEHREAGGEERWGANFPELMKLQVMREIQSAVVPLPDDNSGRR